MIIITVQRNHLVEYYPKERSLPAMIDDHQNDNVFQRFMDQRTRELNNPSTTEEHDSFPFPKEPLRSISPTNKPKRSNTHSNESWSSSPLATSRIYVQSHALPMETSTPIHLLLRMHKLLNRCPGNISVRFNSFLVTVPPAWLEIASTCAPNSLETIARNQIAAILSQCWEQSPGRVMNFDSIYNIARFL